VKDASLIASPSLKGVVIDTKLFARPKKMSKEVERKTLEKLETAHERAVKVLKERLVEKLFTVVNGKTAQGIYNVYKELLVAKGA
jgi:DNA-directed RNA polymerase subunit beta